MALNENIIKGKWLEIKGDIQKSWGKLTDDELDKTKGDMKSISGLIQKRYGETEEKYASKLSDIYKRFDDKKDDTVKSIKDAVKK
jgi:uncharacterized protein YjbJ (UPF0337 family)